MKKYLMTVLILMTACAAGFMLPPRMLSWQDERYLEKSEREVTEKVVLSSQTELTMTEKYLLLQSSMVNTIEMTEGKNYTGKEILEHAEQELQELEELGVLQLELSELNFAIESIRFWIDIQGGTQSMLLWTIQAETITGKLRMQVDDETGKIMTLTYTDKVSKKSSSETKTIKNGTKMKDIAQKWGEYLGIELIETSIYDKTITSGYIEMSKEIESLVKKGMDEEEAEKVIFVEWGIAAEDFENRRLYATYEDEGGIIVLGFRKDTADILFMVDIYN